MYASLLRQQARDVDTTLTDYMICAGTGAFKKVPYWDLDKDEPLNYTRTEAAQKAFGRRLKKNTLATVKGFDPFTQIRPDPMHTLSGMIHHMATSTAFQIQDFITTVCEDSVDEDAHEEPDPTPLINHVKKELTERLVRCGGKELSDKTGMSFNPWLAAFPAKLFDSINAVQKAPTIKSFEYRVLGMVSQYPNQQKKVNGVAQCMCSVYNNISSSIYQIHNVPE